MGMTNSEYVRTIFWNNRHLKKEDHKKFPLDYMVLMEKQELLNVWWQSLFFPIDIIVKIQEERDLWFLADQQEKESEQQN